MGYANIKDLLKTAFAALDAAKDVLPQGREREEMEARLREAPSAMKDWMRSSQKSCSAIFPAATKGQL
jgi:hypothetical protein